MQPAHRFLLWLHFLAAAANVAGCDERPSSKHVHRPPIVDHSLIAEGPEHSIVVKRTVEHQ